MVKLPEESEEPRRAMRERVDPWQPRNHHNWGADARRRGEVHREPTGLLQLEALAHRSVQVMEKHNPKSEKNFDKAMDLLRCQYNLNFIVVCEQCGGQHDYDELITPER